MRACRSAPRQRRRRYKPRQRFLSITRRQASVALLGLIVPKQANERYLKLLGTAAEMFAGKEFSRSAQSIVRCTDGPSALRHGPPRLGRPPVKKRTARPDTSTRGFFRRRSPRH